MTKDLQIPENELQEIYREVTIGIQRSVINYKLEHYKIGEFLIKSVKKG